jgi:hypothetical protein
MEKMKHRSNRPTDAQAPSRPRIGALAFALGLLAASALLVFPSAAANGGGSGSNPGTIKVHDDMTARPETRNEPHVSCDFWVEGFNMAGDSGDLVFTGWAPTGDKSTVALKAHWNGTPESDGKGAHFLAGPFNLTEGHYRVEAFLDEGHPGNTDHSAKSKMFWVEPCSPPGAPPPASLACPSDLKATANGDGSIDLAFTPAPNSTGSNVYRASGSDDFEFLGSVGSNATGFHDGAATPGTTYTYLVTGLFGKRESTDCQTVEATAIPELPTSLAIGLATAGGGLAYAVLRRRTA